MTETTFEKVITQVNEKVDGDEKQLLSYLKKLNAKKFPGVLDYYLKQKNGKTEPSLDLEIEITESKPTKSTPKIEIPGHVKDELAKISAKFSVEYDELAIKYIENMVHEDMDILDFQGQEREKEAWQWILLEMTQAATSGGQLSGYIFTLWSVDSEPGSYNAWMKKSDIPQYKLSQIPSEILAKASAKGEIQISKGIAGGYGVFMKEMKDGTTETFCDYISAFDDEEAKKLTDLKPLVTYSGEISKNKRGFAVDSDSVFEEIEQANEDDIRKLVVKLTKSKVIQPRDLSQIKLGKKGVSVIIDCRILFATSKVTDNNQEYASLKVTDADMSVDAEPKAYIMTFWRDKASMAFTYRANSRVFIGLTIKKSDGDYDYNLTGQFIIPVRAIKQEEPEFADYKAPQE